MTDLRPFLEGYLDLNIALVFSLAIWFVARALLARTDFRAAYPMQLRLLLTLFTCILVSPFLAGAISFGMQTAMPGRSFAVSDIAVAAFLQGSIAMPAVEFEALLNTRQTWIDRLVDGTSTLSMAFLILMVTCIAGLLIRIVCVALTIRNTVATSFLWRKTKHVDIRLSDRVRMPFAVRGFRRRYVVLPSATITRTRETRFVLAHEFQHLRQGDVEWELAFEVLRPLFFWNPALLVWKAQIERLRELSCDQTVVATRGVDVRDYANCLLDISSRNAGASAPRVMNVAFVKAGHARRALRRRIVALRQAAPRHPMGTRSVLFVMAFVFGTLVILGTASIRQTQDWSHDRLMLSTVVNLERLEAINRGF